METILAALGLVFIALKLLGAVDWSWWAVTSPLWVDLAFLVLVSCVASGARTTASLTGDVFSWGARRRKLNRMYLED